MDYLTRNCRVSSLEHVRNETLKESMEVEETITDEIEKTIMVWSH